MKTYPVYLNGELRITEGNFVVKNPATGEALARMSEVKRPEVAEALQHAHEAFETWRQLSGKARGEFLHRIATEVHRRREELARTITLENGKPLAQSQGEVGLAVDYLHWFAEEARRTYGRVLPYSAEERRHLLIKTPVGVVGAITAWTYPLVLAVRKVAPGLAAGCPLVLKVPSATPLTGSVFAECVDAVGLPKGVFQLVAGAAEDIAREFLENPLCRKVSFTGSLPVGKKLIEGAARQVKPLLLELGGHAPVLVFEDANLMRAVDGTIEAKFRNSGQSCIAANRIFVQRPVYEPFVKALAARAKALVVGNGLEPQSQVGPLLDAEGLARALEHVEDAVRGGARLLCGGQALERPGHFMEPTVLADVPAAALCMFEETFGPVAPVSAFDTEAEAVARANNSAAGLGAYVFTRDVSRMFRLGEALEVGMLGINDGLSTASQAPFGGVKQGGWGRELGSEGMEAFLETRHLAIGV